MSMKFLVHPLISPFMVSTLKRIFFLQKFSTFPFTYIFLSEHDKGSNNQRINYCTVLKNEKAKCTSEYDAMSIKLEN